MLHPRKIERRLQLEGGAIFDAVHSPDDGDIVLVQYSELAGAAVFDDVMKLSDAGEMVLVQCSDPFVHQIQVFEYEDAIWTVERRCEFASGSSAYAKQVRWLVCFTDSENGCVGGEDEFVDLVEQLRR